MTVYRAINAGPDGGNRRVQLPGTVTRVTIEVDRDYDDTDPDDKAILDAFPQFFRAPNVESATAAPGERRATRKPKK